ncbi:MAG: hypothetical protein M3Y48_23430 [Actinomycetota bacterium]|nr:hypothetical protein [Actinomycetota bacterium]
MNDEDEFPTESIGSPGSPAVRIRGTNGWTMTLRTDPATRLATLDSENPEGVLVGTRVLGTDDVQRIVDALNEQARTSGGPVVLDVSQVIGRD